MASLVIALRRDMDTTREWLCAWIFTAAGPSVSVRVLVFFEMEGLTTLLQ